MRLVLIKGPIGVVVLVVPHDEGDCWNLELRAVPGDLRGWSRGVAGEGGVSDYVMEAGIV
jgi:hypothetical protein